MPGCMSQDPVEELSEVSQAFEVALTAPGQTSRQRMSPFFSFAGFQALQLPVKVRRSAIAALLAEQLAEENELGAPLLSAQESIARGETKHVLPGRLDSLANRLQPLSMHRLNRRGAYMALRVNTKRRRTAFCSRVAQCCHDESCFACSSAPVAVPQRQKVDLGVIHVHGPITHHSCNYETPIVRLRKCLQERFGTATLNSKPATLSSEQR